MALILKHLDDAKEVMVETSRYVPSDFLIRIESVSLLLKSGVDKHECNEFEAGGYKWRLVIQPNGKENSIDNFVSVYLTLADPFSMGMNWEVYAMFAIFLQDQSCDDQFLCKRLPTRRRLDALNHGMGFSKFISHKCFLDPANGYIVDDSCVFGAEVFVFKRPSVVERLCWMKPEPYIRTWFFPNFFKSGDHERNSDTFVCGGKKWFVKFYPKGDPQALGKGISAFVHIVDPGQHKVNAEFTIRVLSQVKGGKHYQTSPTSGYWFSTSDTMFGFSGLMSMTNFCDPTLGFLINDLCLLQLELTVRAVTTGEGKQQ